MEELKRGLQKNKEECAGEGVRDRGDRTQRRLGLRLGLGFEESNKNMF